MVPAPAKAFLTYEQPGSGGAVVILRGGVGDGSRTYGCSYATAADGLPAVRTLEQPGCGWWLYGAGMIVVMLVWFLILWFLFWALIDFIQLYSCVCVPPHCSRSVMASSYQQVQDFLRDFHGKARVWDILFRDDRGKNALRLCLTWSCVLLTGKRFLWN